jgi:hypothetical protein
MPIIAFIYQLNNNAMINRDFLVDVIKLLFKDKLFKKSMTTPVASLIKKTKNLSIHFENNFRILHNAILDNINAKVSEDKINRFYLSFSFVDDGEGF